MFGQIFSYPNNNRVRMSLIAAKYSNLEVEEVNLEMGVGNRSPEFLKDFPQGIVPAFKGSDGFTLTESGAILYYIASCKKDNPLMGRDPKENAQIVHWLSKFASTLYSNETATLNADLGQLNKPDMSDNYYQKRLYDFMNYANLHLETRTYLLGDRMTIADIAFHSYMHTLFLEITDEGYADRFPNVKRLFEHMFHQKVVSEFFGTELKYPKEAKYKALTAYSPNSKINPFDLLPPTNFNLHEWRTKYNNESTSETLDWFWKNYDPKGYTMYKVTYNYSNELRLTFMSKNLISGFFQRIEAMGKYAFAFLAVLGKDNDNHIRGYFIIRGNSYIPDLIKESADFPSYTFQEVNPNDENVRKNFNEFLSWGDTVEGLPLADAKTL